MGHVPFEGTRYEILDKQVKLKLPSKNIKNVRLRRIVEKACDKKQELRYQTSAEMRVDIESLDIKRASDPRKKRTILIAILSAIILLLGGLGGASWYSSHKEAENIALKEKNTRDSLFAIINTSVKQAKELAQKGYRHDEGFDKNLVEAKLLYDKADTAVKQLKEKNIGIDYNADKQKLIEALNNALEELKQKVEILNHDPDPIVVEEAKVISERIKVIENAISH